MKKYILSVMALATVALTGCTDRDTEGLTGITTYPVLTLNGGDMIVQKGTSFEDPGCTADLGGVDYSDNIITSSDVDTKTSGVYTVSYSVYNEDGFSASASRSVVVVDMTDPIEGYYAVSATSYRDRSGTQTVYGEQYNICIFNNGDGTYYCEDLLGGYYCQRAGYGSNYALTGYFSVDSTTGAVSLLSSSLIGWGDSADGMTDGSYNFTTHALHYNVGYASMSFIQDLTRLEEL